MLLFVAALARGHSPTFPLSGYPADASNRLIDPLASALFFDRGAQQYRVRGDAARVQARSPLRRGAFASGAGGVSVTVASNCELAAAPVGTETVYDPLLETEMVPLWEITVNADCTFNITTDPPDTIYALAVGEASVPVADIAGTGLPILIMFSSAWADNYIYGFAVVILGLAAAAYGIAGNPHAAAAAAAAVLAASTASRAWQSTSAALGGGLVFLAMSLGASMACVHAAGDRRALLAVLALTVLLPTHSWIDVIAVAIAASCATDHNGPWPSRPVAARTAPSTVPTTPITTRIVIVPARF
ncbi:hypothetical protein [Nereida ignava]|uniref:hypothetical protein n=1 Tax=Nereida ignava TaxID=282199 RepID=UPI0030F91853